MMIQHEKTRGQRHAVNFGIVIAALYTIFATIFMVTLYRLAVAQTARIQSLETVAGELAARVRRLENSFTAQTTGFKSVGETGHVLEEKSTRLKTKLALSDPPEKDRNKRQMEGYCPCLQGRRGKKGKRGHKGDQGPKGDEGPPGPEGPKGPPGENGNRGAPGETGPKGAQGLRGEKGDPGRLGDKGDPGDMGHKGGIGPKGSKGDTGPGGPRGPPGFSMSESIHLVGDGSRIKNPSSHRISNWNLRHKEGNISYHGSAGVIEVKRTGYYFIYSQMYYYDGTSQQMGHYTYINHDKVLESMGSVISASKKYNTKYHGGVFLLREGDTISVRIPYTKNYYMDSEGSFFVSKRTVKNWEVQHKSGGLQYSDGTVQIQIAGFYYVYSQMFYHDGSAYQMTHQLYVNSRKFMQSTSAVVSKERMYSTNYNGGVVFLNATDNISVRTPFSRFYQMDPSHSYFGAFLLHSVTHNTSTSKRLQD